MIEHILKLFLFLCFSPRFIHHSFSYLLWLSACPLDCLACVCKLQYQVSLPASLKSDLFHAMQAEHWMKTKWQLQFAEPLVSNAWPCRPSCPSFHTSRLHLASTKSLFKTQPKLCHLTRSLPWLPRLEISSVLIPNLFSISSLWRFCIVLSSKTICNYNLGQSFPIIILKIMQNTFSKLHLM